MTLTDFAVSVGETEAVIRNWIARGRLVPTGKFGKQLVFSNSDVAKAKLIRGETRSMGASYVALTDDDHGLLITIEQAAELIGITSRQVHRLMTIGPGQDKPLLQGYRTKPSAAAKLSQDEVAQYIAHRSRRSA
jgi:DNA-binding transcriptional MerR regulator